MSIDYKNLACIVGVGQSPYALQVNRSPVSMQTEAFRNALADAGLEKSQIDGFNTAHGAPTGVDYDEFVAHAGLDIRWVIQHQNHGRWSSTALASAAFAVASGQANYVAVCNATLSNRGYGKFFRAYREGWGEDKRDVSGGHGEIDWLGLDTPGAGTSLAARMYMEKYGATSEELATVALTFRKHANMNPNAIMFDRPMDLDDYMNSRFITPPYRLFDYCLVNDGGVALILQRADMAKDAAQTPISISGFGWREADRENTQLRPRLKDFYHSAHHGVRDQVYPMSGLGPKDIDVYSTYDSFSTHVLLTLEGFGFCGEGESGAFIQDGRIGIGGELPVNTSGGMMSESYMQSWNHQVELVRQLRHTYEGGPRQVANAEVGQYVFDGSGRCHSVIYTRGN